MTADTDGNPTTRTESRPGFGGKDPLLQWYSILALCCGCLLLLGCKSAMPVAYVLLSLVTKSKCELLAVFAKYQYRALASIFALYFLFFKASVILANCKQPYIHAICSAAKGPSCWKVLT